MVSQSRQDWGAGWAGYEAPAAGEQDVPSHRCLRRAALAQDMVSFLPDSSDSKFLCTESSYLFQLLKRMLRFARHLAVVSPDQPDDAGKMSAGETAMTIVGWSLREAREVGLSNSRSMAQTLMVGSTV